MSLGAWIGLAVAGGLGSVARAWIGRTLLVNVTGAFALGLVVGLGVDGEARFVVAVGLLGGYTTFSTWMLQSRRAGVAAVAAPLALGFAAVLLGHELGGMLAG